uniref:Uncharacterized protein n=1 Tax=Cacopsylla melanoneura TaxID=428564 RepID=A0A8D9DZQ7_9HEMI
MLPVLCYRGEVTSVVPVSQDTQALCVRKTSTSVKRARKMCVTMGSVSTRMAATSVSVVPGSPVIIVTLTLTSASPTLASTGPRARTKSTGSRVSAPRGTRAKSAVSILTSVNHPLVYTEPPV